MGAGPGPAAGPGPGWRGPSRPHPPRLLGRAARFRPDRCRSRLRPRLRARGGRLRDRPGRAARRPGPAGLGLRPVRRAQRLHGPAHARVGHGGRGLRARPAGGDARPLRGLRRRPEPLRRPPSARGPGRALSGDGARRGRGLLHKMPLFFGLEAVLKRTPAPGSNAFAVTPARSADGDTRLAVNSHQPWGPVAWYEVHLLSDDGWDAVGGTFPGAPIVLHGHNRTLGWAHTVNMPDLIDVYLLEVDPKQPDRYRFDGGWRDLEKRGCGIEVKLLGPFCWTFDRAPLCSVYGP